MSLAGLLAGWRRPAALLPVTPAMALAEPLAPAGTQSVTRTHVGRVRTINEDRVFADDARGLWAVADGMGGHFAGDVAAEAIVDALRRLAEGPFGTDDIGRTFAEVGHHIHAQAAGSTRVSGSTVVALHIDGTGGTIFWAGDSRIYRARTGWIEQLTRDHSLVQELVDAGALAPELADRHPQAHVVTRALGASADVVIERRAVTVEPGDVYLLCSDGLTRGVSAASLIARGGASLGAVADTLVAEALGAGGADNISLVLVAVG